MPLPGLLGTRLAGMRTPLMPYLSSAPADCHPLILSPTSLARRLRRRRSRSLNCSESAAVGRYRRRSIVACRRFGLDPPFVLSDGDSHRPGILSPATIERAMAGFDFTRTHPVIARQPKACWALPPIKTRWRERLQAGPKATWKKRSLRRGDAPPRCER